MSATEDFHGFPNLPAGDLWVFGYGSLMWNPGFDYRERHKARLYGFHRSLCVWSWVHRGTRENPGLVFGLDTGGSCLGRLYRVAAANKQSVIEYLRAREMVTPVYLPRLVPVHWDYCKGTALTFVIDRQHAQYAGKLDVEHAATVVSRARGGSGHNAEYVRNTLAHLEELSIIDDMLKAIILRLDTGIHV